MLGKGNRTEEIKKINNDGKFNGARLKSARKYRGKTIIELANDIDVSKQAVSQYENGTSAPVFEVLMKIIKALKFPREYFYEEDSISINLGNTYFRASSKLTKKEKSIQKEKSILIGKIFNVLNEYLDFPKLNLPSVNHDLSIDEIALQVREYWNLGDEPITDMIYVLEKNGIVVTSMNTNTDTVDAYSLRQDINGKTNYVVVLGNDKFSAARRQFSAAHELGHIILHDDFLEMDQMSKEEIRDIENQAHQFASAFLLPKNTFARDIAAYPTNLDYYVQLKKKWRTSISAMLVRANNIGILAYTSYQALERKISRLGWRTSEPLDDTLIMNQPTLLKRAVNILIDNDLFTPEEFIKELSKNKISLNGDEIEELLGLDKGTLKLKKSNDKVIDLKIKIES